MAAINMPRPPEITLFYTWQMLWQGVELNDIAEFLQTDTEYLVALLVGRIEKGNVEVQGVRNWAKNIMITSMTHTARNG